MVHESETAASRTRDLSSCEYNALTIRPSGRTKKQWRKIIVNGDCNAFVRPYVQFGRYSGRKLMSQHCGDEQRQLEHWGPYKQTRAVP